MSSATPNVAGGSKPAAYGAKEQISRLLRLVPMLHARGEIRLSEAAEILEVSERQVTKDLKVLWMCGLPGGLPDDLIDVDMDALETPEGDRVIRVHNADYLARPMRLSPTEATALIVALRALRDSAESATQEIVDRSLAKLEQAAAGATPIVHATSTKAENEWQAQIGEAVTAGRQLELTYYVPTRDEESVRVVDPHRLSHVDGATYLDAWCHQAEAPRWFRLDRIRELRVLESGITIEPADADETTTLTPEWLESSTTVVTLALDPAAHWIAEYYPHVELRTVDENRIEVDLRVADPRWLVRLVLGAAPHATVVAPGEFAHLLTQTVDRTLTLYAAGQ